MKVFVETIKVMFVDFLLCFLDLRILIALLLVTLFMGAITGVFVLLYSTLFAVSAVSAVPMSLVSAQIAVGICVWIAASIQRAKENLERDD